MSRPITHVKREIRILGLDTCNPRVSIGVVIRGGLFLDGVIVYPRGVAKSASEIARKVTETKYFPELRALMVHDPAERLDSQLIQRVTRLPVIDVSHIKNGNSRSYVAFSKNDRKLWFKAQIEKSTLEKILSFTWTKGRLPEPLRIAHLIAKQSGIGRRFQDKE